MLALIGIFNQVNLIIFIYKTFARNDTYNCFIGMRYVLFGGEFVGLNPNFLYRSRLNHFI